MCSVFTFVQYRITKTPGFFFVIYFTLYEVCIARVSRIVSAWVSYISIIEIVLNTYSTFKWLIFILYNRAKSLHFLYIRIYPLPNVKMLDLSKLVALADDKVECDKKKIEICDRKGKNIVGKGENAGHQHFLLFPQCFQKLSSTGSLKVGNVW